MTEQLELFIEEANPEIVGLVIEEAVSDSVLYDQNDVVGEALIDYMEMLENDNVDEEFEENLSVMLYPYMESIFPMFEGVYKDMKAARRTKKGKLRVAAKEGKMEAPIYQNREAKKTPKKTDIKFKDKLDMYHKKNERKERTAANKKQWKKENTGIRGLLKSIRTKMSPKRLLSKISTGLKNVKNFTSDKYGKMKAGVASKLKTLSKQAKPQAANDKEFAAAAKKLAAAGA